MSSFLVLKQHKHCSSRAVAAPLRQAAPERDVLGPMASCHLQPLAVPTVPGIWDHPREGRWPGSLVH